MGGWAEKGGALRNSPRRQVKRNQENELKKSKRAKGERPHEVMVRASTTPTEVHGGELERKKSQFRAGKKGGATMIFQSGQNGPDGRKRRRRIGRRKIGKNRASSHEENGKCCSAVSPKKGAGRDRQEEPAPTLGM